MGPDIWKCAATTLALTSFHFHFLQFRTARKWLHRTRCPALNLRDQTKRSQPGGDSLWGGVEYHVLWIVYSIVHSTPSAAVTVCEIDNSTIYLWVGCEVVSRTGRLARGPWTRTRTVQDYHSPSTASPSLDPSLPPSASDFPRCGENPPALRTPHHRQAILLVWVYVAARRRHKQ